MRFLGQHSTITFLFLIPNLFPVMDSGIINDLAAVQVGVNDSNCLTCKLRVQDLWLWHKQQCPFLSTTKQGR